MTILDKIIAHKKVEVARKKKELSLEELSDAPSYDRTCFSLLEKLKEKESTGIIAEFKRKSPSKGLINVTATVAEVTAAYTRCGAAGLSILTDESFFGGSMTDLVTGRENSIPILRKDFIIDPYQVIESKSNGADIILLIAACLSIPQTNELAEQAKSIGLEVLLELHDENELEHICKAVDMIGINSRNLKTFEVDREAAVRLVKLLPTDKPTIAESGIDNPSSLRELRSAGFSGFLIGEHFMKASNPGLAFETFVQSLK